MKLKNFTLIIGFLIFNNFFSSVDFYEINKAKIIRLFIKNINTYDKKIKALSIISSLALVCYVIKKTGPKTFFIDAWKNLKEALNNPSNDKF